MLLGPCRIEVTFSTLKNNPINVTQPYSAAPPGQKAAKIGAGGGWISFNFMKMSVTGEK